MVLYYKKKKKKSVQAPSHENSVMNFPHSRQTTASLKLLGK